MREVYRGRDLTRVGQMRGVLEAEGIRTFVRNENLSVTEVSIPVFAPALCVMDDADLERAVALIRDYETAPPVDAAGELRCPECGETSPGNFAGCWNCGSPLDG